MEGLKGLRVVTFEARKASEMASLLRKQGGEPLSAPAMREVPLDGPPAATELGEALLKGECEVLVLLTGAGTRLLLDAMERRWPGGEPLASLQKVALAARGPKTVKALKDRGLLPAVVSLEPATSGSLLAELKKVRPLSGARVYVQEYGERNDTLLEALRAEGARATPLTLYSWALPESLEPLHSAIEGCIAGRIEVALFTSARQVANLFLVAGRSGRGEPLRQALGRMVVGSIGPVTDEALEEHGLSVDVRPELARMGQLVSAVAERAAGILAGKRP